MRILKILTQWYPLQPGAAAVAQDEDKDDDEEEGGAGSCDSNHVSWAEPTPALETG